MAISSFSSSIVTPYVSPYFLLLGGSEVLLGFFWSIYSILNLALVLPGGYVADTLGRKNILVLMTSLTAIAFMVFSGSPLWPFLFIPQSLIAISAISSPAREAILADSMPEKQRSTGFALVFALSSVGWTFGPLVGGYFYDNGGVWGIRVAFIFSAIGTVITALVYYAFLKETLFPIKNEQATSTDQRQSSLATQALRRFTTEMRSALNQMTLPAKKFLIGSMFYDASGAIVSAYWSLLILYSMGFSGVELGFIEMAAGLSLIAFSIPMGRFSDKIGRPKAALLITTLSSLILVWVVNSHLFLEVLLIGSLLDIFDPRPPIHGLRADVIPREIRGRVISFLSVAGYATAAVTLAAGGLLYTIAPQLPFYLSAALLGISGICFASAGHSNPADS